MERHVLILSRVLTVPQGTVQSQSKLGMDDAQLDEFIAAGHAIEHDAPLADGGVVDAPETVGEGRRGRRGRPAPDAAPIDPADSEQPTDPPAGWGDDGQGDRQPS